MFKSMSDSADITSKAHQMRQAAKRRSHSISMPKSRDASPSAGRRRCHSLSPSANEIRREIFVRETNAYDPTQTARPPVADGEQPEHVPCCEKECSLPQCVVIKMLRSLAIKKRDFVKMRKGLIAQQNTLLEQYAQLKELENKVGSQVDETLGEVRVLSVSNWPAHDLLLLVREDLRMPMDSEIGGIFGPQVLQQLHAQLTPIPDEVLGFGTEILNRRLDLLILLRGQKARERPSYQANLEWKSKTTELDVETERLQKQMTHTVENIKAKISYSLELAKIPWLDRDALVRKAERLQRENTVLSHRLDELKKEENFDRDNYSTDSNMSRNRQVMEGELKKERAAREALKEVVASAENMLRVARARIATLERQLKEAKSELETTRRKHKELEQLVKNSQCAYRHRETSYDLRSRRLVESSKTGEMAIEALSRQRDALETRVKELREQMEIVENSAECRDAEFRSKIESLQAKLLDQERKKEAAEAKVLVTEERVNQLEEDLDNLRRHCSKLVETERRKCLDYIPAKENEPSERETEIWKELQSTRLALSRTEEQLRLARADKDDFLQSLSRIAADGGENIQEKMSAELLDREQKITRLQQTIEKQKENEKIMEQGMTQYENELASLRLEIRRLKNYDCYVKDIPCQELETEKRHRRDTQVIASQKRHQRDKKLFSQNKSKHAKTKLLDLQMQLEKTQREHSSLVNAAATRALMLERHEKAAELFARVTKARRDIAAILSRRSDPPPVDGATQAEASRSLSTLCATAADTWSSLRSERERVTRLERAVLSQSLQLERESRVRTQLERRRALLEREILRAHQQALCLTSETTPLRLTRNPGLLHDLFCFR